LVHILNNTFDFSKLDSMVETNEQLPKVFELMMQSGQKNPDLELIVLDD
jgi:hypothetical protein